MVKKSKDTFIHQPHDKLVKRLLSNPAAAKDILSLYLPKEVLAITDLSYLEMQKDSFIDDEHRTYAVDILYKTKFQNEEGYIWVLLEHQRKSDMWMPVRIFKYIGIIWDHLRKANKSKFIPLIYPLIVYNGDKSYNHSLTLSDLIKPNKSKDIFSTLFTKPFQIIDLANIQDETLRLQAKNHVKGTALLMALKHAFDRNFQAFFEEIMVKILQQLGQEGNIDEVIDILFYILNESEFLDKNRFFEILNRHQFPSEVENKMSTIAQQLKNEGIEKGKIEGKIEVAKQLLSEEIGLSDAELLALIERLTGLSEDTVQELRKKH